MAERQLSSSLLDQDGLEQMMEEEAIRQSLLDSNIPDDNTPIYRADDVHIESQPHRPGTGRIPGSLQVMTQNSKQYLCWSPHAKDDQIANAYTMRYATDEIKFLRRTSSRQLEIMLLSSVSLPPLVFKSADIESLFEFMKIHAPFVQQQRNVLVHKQADYESKSLRDDRQFSVGWLFDKVRDGFVSIAQNIKQLDQPSRVPNRPTFVGDDYPVSSSSNPQTTQPPHEFNEDDSAPSSEHSVDQNDEEEAATDTEQQTQRHQQVFFRERETGALGDFEVIDNEELPPRELRPREEQLTLEEFYDYFDESKTVCTNQALLRERIFKGGIANEARPTVWKFMLGYWPTNDESEEDFHSEKCLQYQMIKNQWVSITPAQLKNNSRMRELFLGVKKDVHRSDRTLPCFQENEEENLTALKDILISYGMYNFDLGYVQGMSDLVAVILSVLKDETQTFWCFVSWMEKIATRFQIDSTTKQLLATTSELLLFVDGDFMNYLEEKESAHLIFCFRWFIVFFCREFPFSDTCIMWDALFSHHLSQQFEIFVTLSILMDLKNRLKRMESGATLPQNEIRVGPEVILQVANDLGQYLDVTLVLRRAEAIWHQLKGYPATPVRFQGLLTTWVEHHSIPQDMAEAKEPLETH